MATSRFRERHRPVVCSLDERFPTNFQGKCSVIRLNLPLAFARRKQKFFCRIAGTILHVLSHRLVTNLRSVLCPLKNDCNLFWQPFFASPSIFCCPTSVTSSIFGGARPATPCSDPPIGFPIFRFRPGKLTSMTTVGRMGYPFQRSQWKPPETGLDQLALGTHRIGQCSQRQYLQRAHPQQLRVRPV